MPDPLTWMILIGTALLGSTIGGIAGFGAGILLLPVAAWTLGTRAAVPVLTVTMLLGNLARIWWSRGELHGGLTLRFIAGAVPTTALAVNTELFRDWATPAAEPAGAVIYWYFNEVSKLTDEVGVAEAEKQAAAAALAGAR